MKFALFLLILTFAVGAFGQKPELEATRATKGIVEQIFIARDDGRGKAGEIVESFNTNDIPIYCIVMLSRSDPVTVKMDLVAVKVSGVKPETKVVSAGYTTKQGQNRVNFSGRPDDSWVAGIYRFDVRVDGKIEKSLTFEMTQPSSPVPVSSFLPVTRKTPQHRKN